MVPTHKARSKHSKRKHKIRRVTLIRIVAVLVTSIVLGATGVALAEFLLSGDFVELDTIEVHGDNLLLGANCKGMIGGISTERGQYIQLGLDKKLDARPNVYDVFRDTLEQYDIALESVRITHIENNHFLSIMTLSDGNKILEADARPSDAIALALRTGSKIYFNKSFLNENGIDICSESAT